MISLLQSKRAELATLCHRFHVDRLEVFGSAARGDDYDPESSDVDFLVEFAADSPLSPLDAWYELEQALSETLHRKVELVSPSAIRNPYVRASIECFREVVYGA